MSLTSDALGSLYVITPVELLYASEPSPPESVTEISCIISVYAAEPASVNVPMHHHKLQ